MPNKNLKSDGEADASSRNDPSDPSNASNEPNASPLDDARQAAAARSNGGSSAKGEGEVDVAGAYGEFMNRMAESTSSFEKQYSEQVTAYTEALKDAERQITEALSQAAQRYGEQLQAAWGESELSTKVTKAYKHFAGLAEEHASLGNLQRTMAEAYAGFLTGLTPTSTGQSSDNPEERHRSYLDAIKKAWEQSELQKGVLEAHAEYLLLLQQLQQQGWQHAQEAQQTYEQSVHEALSSSELPKRANEVLEKSISVLQQAWQKACEQYNVESARVLKVMEQAAGSMQPAPFSNSGSGTERRAGG